MAWCISWPDAFRTKFTYFHPYYLRVIKIFPLRLAYFPIQGLITTSLLQAHTLEEKQEEKRRSNYLLCQNSGSIKATYRDEKKDIYLTRLGILAT